MVDVKGAVANATDFAKSLLDPERAADIRLEELDSSTTDGRPVWLVTLSNPPRATDLTRVLGTMIGGSAAREYRVFAVVKDTGEVVSMKIKLFATAQ